MRTKVRLDPNFFPVALEALNLIDFEDRLVAADLTSDGVQWSSEYTTTGNEYEEAFKKTVDPAGIFGEILWVEFGLTCAIKSSGATEGVAFKWQARNKDGTWVDLHPEVTRSADASAYAEYTRQGFFKTVANFNKVPCDVRLVIKSTTAGGENAIARVKSSSYVRVVFKAT